MTKLEDGMGIMSIRGLKLAKSWNVYAGIRKK